MKYYTKEWYCLMQNTGGYKCPSMDDEISFEVDIDAVKEHIKEDINPIRLLASSILTP